MPTTLPILSITGATVTEGNTGTRNLSFTFRLSQASDAAVTFQALTNPVTATEVMDFQGGQGTFTIPAGQTSLSLNVVTAGDTVSEGSETLQLLVGNVQGATLAGGGSVISATGTIVDDDRRPTAPANNVLALTLASGTVYIEMRPDVAPLHVARIKELVREGFYNNLTFHRVLDGFMAQGGDPDGNGTGGSGQNITAEFSTLPFVRGTVGMARASAANSADSQFFIMFQPTASLNGQYTVWGQVIDGMERVDRITRIDPANPTTPPTTPDRLLRMTVESMRVSHGTARADTLTGGTGKDFLLGGTGADTLNAGAANDRINGGTGNDRINGGTGTDTLILSGARTAYTVTRLATTAVTYQIKGPDGTDRVTGVERVEFGGAAPVTIGTLVSSRRRAADRMADALTTHQPTLSAATTAPAGAKSNTGLLDALAAGPW